MTVSLRTSPPSRVLLLDLGWRQTGYVVAALCESGIETILLTTERPDNIGLKHYCKQITSPYPHSPAYLPFLRQQIATLRPDLLIPLCEPLMELLWDIDPPCEVPIYPATTEHQRQVLRDRRRLYEHAAASGLAVAPWLPIGSPADLDRAIRRFGYPFAIRGTSGFAGGQVRIVSSASEATEALEQLKSKSPGQPFAQAFVRGRRHLIGGLFRDGEAIRLFPQEVIEAYPPLTGPSIRVRPHLDETLIRITRALFANLEWTGLACADFICDERGRFIFMEVNPRPWGSIEVAERAGVGVCRAFAETLAGRAVAPQHRSRTGGSEITLEAFLLARRQGRGLGGTLRTLRTLTSWDLLDCMRAVPWTSPWLALYVMRRLYREFS